MRGTIDPRGMSMIERELAEAREQRHRRRVRFDPARRVIDVAGYRLDLDRARNAVELLDWLFQIAYKGWCDPQLLRDVIYELDDACRIVLGKGIQGVYCPWEQPRVVDWRRGVTRPARLVEEAENGNLTSGSRGKRKLPAKGRR